jgi:ABC-type sugar transport system substrate-binding protein
LKIANINEKGEKMKKSIKILGMILVFVMLSAMIAGCGGAPAAPAATTGEQAAAPATTTDEQPAVAATTTGEKVAVDTNKPAFDEFPRPRIVTDRPLKVVLITHPNEAESRERTRKQVIIEADHYGWELTIMEVADASEYKDAFLSAINLNVDAIHVGNLNSMSSIVDVIAQARNAGIGVYNDDNEVVKGIIGNSTMPNGVASMQLAYYVGEQVGWKANVIYPSIPVMQVHMERLDPVLTLAENYPNWKNLEVIDVTSWPGGPAVAMSEIPNIWVDKYADQMTGIFCTADGICTSAAEVFKSRGYDNPNLWMAGIDGGSDAFAYIRAGTPFRYDYSQPFEAYAHFTNQIIMDVQVKGLNPGDPGCIISKVGEAVYTEGAIVTRENVPAVGTVIHTLYKYYDPNATDAWYTWETPKEKVYVVSEGGVQE